MFKNFAFIILTYTTNRSLSFKGQALPLLPVARVLRHYFDCIMPFKSEHRHVSPRSTSPYIPLQFSFKNIKELFSITSFNFPVLFYFL